MSNNLGNQVDAIGHSPAMIPNTRFAKVELFASPFLMRSCHPERYFVDIVTARKVLAGS